MMLPQKVIVHLSVQISHQGKVHGMEEREKVFLKRVRAGGGEGGIDRGGNQ